MDKIKQLIAEREACLTDAQAILDTVKAEERSRTDEEKAEYTRLKEQAADLKKEIAALEEEDREAKELADEKAWTEHLQPRLTKPQPPAPVKMPTRIEEKPPEKFGSFGEFLGAVARFEVTKERDNRLVGPMAVGSGLNEATPAEGGFLVQQEHVSTILQRAYETGTILSRCRRIPLGPNSNGVKIPYINESSRATGSRLGGIRGYWVDEGGSPTASNPKFGRVELNLHKIACVGYATEELLQDTTALGSLMEDGFAEEIIFQCEDAIIRGTGAGQPLGILNAACAVEVSKATSQTADTIWGDNVVSMWGRCWAKSRPNAVWLISQDSEPSIWSMSARSEYESGGTTALPLVIPAGYYGNTSGFPLLFGRPVITSEYCDTVGTTGDIILADFSQYLLIDKGGPNLNQSMHVRFVQDEMTFKATYRIDGQPWWPSALTPYKGSNTVSPFVTLADRD